MSSWTSHRWYLLVGDLIHVNKPTSLLHLNITFGQFIPLKYSRAETHDPNYQHPTSISVLRPSSIHFSCPPLAAFWICSSISLRKKTRHLHFSWAMKNKNPSMSMNSKQIGHVAKFSKIWAQKTKTCFQVSTMTGPIFGSGPRHTGSIWCHASCHTPSALAEWKVNWHQLWDPGSDMGGMTPKKECNENW